MRLKVWQCALLFRSAPTLMVFAGIDGALLACDADIDWAKVETSGLVRGAK
jgi:hypothetical protein